MQGTFSTVAFWAVWDASHDGNGGKKEVKHHKMLLHPTSTVDHVDLSVSKISENCLYLDRKIEQEEEKIQKEIKAGATSVEFQMKTTLGDRCQRTDLFLGSSFFVGSFRFWKSWETLRFCAFFFNSKIRGMSLQNFEKSIGILAKVLYQSDLVNPINSFPTKNHFRGSVSAPHLSPHPRE